jgi:glycogen synthase
MNITTMASHRFLFATGPGDSVSALEAWSQGKPYIGSLPNTFTAEILDFCQKYAAFAVLISSNNRVCSNSWGRGYVQNLPKAKLRGGNGIYFHIAEILYTFKLLKIALSTRANYAFIDSGTSHWFSFFLFRAFGIRLIANLHNTPLALHGPRSWAARIIHLLDRLFFKYLVSGASVVSSTCEDQVRTMMQSHRPIVRFRPNYNLDEFANVADICTAPTHLLFVGRIEENKGVFDVLQMFVQLRKSGFSNLKLEICGAGSSLADVKRYVENHNLGDFVSLSGQLNRYDLLKAYERSSIVLVPTRSTFSEGFAMVCGEANLCARPVIASSVVPAARHLSSGCLVFEADNNREFESVTLKLLSDPDQFHALSKSARKVALDYFSEGYSFSGALEKAFIQVNV